MDALASTSTDETLRNDAFLSWFRSRGGSVHSGVGITCFPTMGRGAVALKDIKKDTVLFTLPRSLTLSMRTSSLPSKFGEHDWRKHQLHKGWAGLILCMLWEDHAGENGHWGGYLSSLPERFQTPMFWSDDDLEELRGTSIFDKIGRDEAEKEFENKLLPAIKSRPDLFPPTALDVHYTLHKYHIMGSRILSRSFHVEKWEEDEDDRSLAVGNKSDTMDVDSTEQDPRPAGEHDMKDGEESDDEDEENPSDVAMVPFADILNALYRSENAKLCYDSEDLQMICTRDIQSGEQILNTYGDPPNSDLLRRYGHVDVIPLSNGVQGNPADVVDIRADVVLDIVRSQCQNGNESLLERIEWWLEEGGDDAFTLETNYALPEELISLIRLLLMPSVEWAKTKGKGKLPRPQMDSYVLQILESVLRKRMEDYKTTLEDDEAFLDATEGVSIKYMATMVRVGEQRILRGALEEVKRMLANEHKNHKKRSIESGESAKSSKKIKR